MARIILDTDLAMGAPGSDVDDGFALALAHADPDITIELITTVNGNTDVVTATLLTAELQRRLDITGIPLAQGAAHPLVRPDAIPMPKSEVLERYQDLERAPVLPMAAQEIIRTVLRHPGEVTVVAIGPLTNIAQAIMLEPKLASSMKELVVMGGVFLETTGRKDMPGEFNVWMDPEAAQVVLRSGAKQRWVGLDVTRKTRICRRDASALTRSPDSFGALAAEATIAWIDYLSEREPGNPDNRDSCAMHDPLAVAAVTHPEFLTWRDAHLDVVTGQSIAAGVMICDLLQTVDHPKANCQIAVDVDANAFKQHFISRISSI